MGSRRFSRANFSKALSAAGAAGAVGSSALLRGASAREGLVDDTRPTDLAFSVREQYRPFDLLAKNFVKLRDGFDTVASAANYGVLSPAPADDAGDASFGGGFRSLLRRDARRCRGREATSSGPVGEGGNRREAAFLRFGYGKAAS